MEQRVRVNIPEGEYKTSPIGSTRTWFFYLDPSRVISAKTAGRIVQVVRARISGEVVWHNSDWLGCIDLGLYWLGEDWVTLLDTHVSGDGGDKHMLFEKDVTDEFRGGGGVGLWGVQALKIDVGTTCGLPITSHLSGYVELIVSWNEG